MPRDAMLSTHAQPSWLATSPREARSMLAYDITLAWAALLLLAIGLVMVYSASIAMAEASAHTGYRPWYFLARHTVFVTAGLASAFVAFQIPEQNTEILDCGHNHKYIPRTHFNCPKGKLKRHCLLCSMEQFTG